MDFYKYNIWWTQLNDLNSYYDAFSFIQIVKVSKKLFSTAYDSFIIFLAYGWYWFLQSLTIMNPYIRSHNDTNNKHAHPCIICDPASQNQQKVAWPSFVLWLEIGDQGQPG